MLSFAMRFHFSVVACDRTVLYTALKLLILAIAQPNLKPLPIDKRLQFVLAHECQWEDSAVRASLLR